MTWDSEEVQYRSSALLVGEMYPLLLFSLCIAKSTVPFNKLFSPFWFT